MMRFVVFFPCARVFLLLKIVNYKHVSIQILINVQFLSHYVIRGLSYNSCGFTACILSTYVIK